MSQTAIPNEFAKYMQNQISVGLAPDMNEMIFAYIPDLDPSQPIDLTQGLPSVGTWVHQQDIDQLGKLGDNALVYSTIIENDKEFTFNAIYLRDKNVPNSCGMVVHKAEETKELGSTLTRSLMMEYVNAAQIVGVIDDAATWQIDYQARLKGIEEDHRLACLDNYGHTAFVDGFDVTQQADPNKYKITPGVVYVGGLRAVLAGEVLQTITTKPNGIYIDVVRDGTALSAWENTLTIKVSTTPLNDYVDEAGRNHYVAKLAGINADGSVVDWRIGAPDEKLMQSMVGMVVPFHVEGEKKGWLDGKGGEVSRIVDKPLWEYALDTGLVVSQAVKDADPMEHAMKFGDGDGATTFTLPNHHLGHFVRGTPSGVGHGETQGDAIRNLYGVIVDVYTGLSVSASGAFSRDTIGPVSAGTQPSQSTAQTFTFDASRVVPTAAENRPMTANLSIKIHRGWM